RNETNISAYAFERKFADLTTIKQQCPLRGVIDAWNQADQRALSRSGRTDNGKARPRRNVQVDVLENFAAGRIRKSQIAKFEIAANCGHLFQIGSGVGIRNRRLFRKYLIDAPQRGGAALKQIDHPSESDHRPGELDHVRVVSNELANVHAAE